MEDKSKKIYGNDIDRRAYRKAVNSKKRFAKKYGDDSRKNYTVTVNKNKYIGDALGVYDVRVGDKSEVKETEKFDTKSGIIVGNIRMGFGHYRISMAIASAANAMGCYLYDGSRSLVAGICTYIMKNGFDVGGFDAYVTTQVIPSAGVSSSASYEMLICAIINFMFNDNKMTENDCAKAGQYAENEFWHKSSGLMDQITCAVGGAVYMDFSDENEVKFTKKNLSFEKFGYSLVIVNTGKGHVDLSEEYSAIPKEMFSVAEVLGCKRLCETNIDELMKVILNHDSYNDAGSILHSDRAVLRAIHFFEENERVDRMAEAIDNDDFDLIKRMIDESGKSSWELLQNCYCPNNPSEQKISLALTLTGRFLKGTDSVCRVHGGGFAGVIMCILPVKDVYSYKDYMEHIFGKGNVYVASIRNYGAVKVELV